MEMHKFFKEERGDVVKYLIVLAAIIAIASFFFPKTKHIVGCAQKTTETGMKVVFEEQVKSLVMVGMPLMKLINHLLS